MGYLFLQSERQMARISPFFPLSHDVPRVDDRRVVSGIVHVIRNGLQWKDAPKGLRVAQDALQPLHPLEPDGGVRPHLRRRCRKLDPKKRREIAESVLSGRKSGAEMARLYDVSELTVSHIVAEHRQNLETDNASQP